LVAGAFSGFIEFVCFLAFLVIGKKEKPSLCNSLGFMRLFSFWLFYSCCVENEVYRVGLFVPKSSCLAVIFSLLKRLITKKCKKGGGWVTD